MDKVQRNVVIACFLGWALDAFDFFILVFVLGEVGKEFGTNDTGVSIAITLTLAARPIGAFLFGRAADKYGRRPTLMINIVIYSLLEFASGFAPDLTIFILLRFLYGIAMGGEWGVGASLTMETIPAKWRGTVSGLLQAGYPTGYLLATLVYRFAFPSVGWRGMFMLGALPALLVLYIRRNVPESPSFVAGTTRIGDQAVSIIAVFKKRWPIFLYAIIMMTAFNFFSHGTQDLYPRFLETDHEFDRATRTNIAIFYNIGAILGGITLGTISQRIGRRKAIAIAALLALPAVPVWAGFVSADPYILAVGAFVLQFMVQGAWGVIPAHLNELSPSEIRGTFPGFTYQLGNLIASSNATLQAWLAASFFDKHYAYPLAIVVSIVALVIAVFVGFGKEAYNADMNARTSLAD